MPAPIALFAYCRPVHLARTIKALQRNPEARDSSLYVFADAPKNSDAEPGVKSVRELLRDVGGFANVSLVLREENYGLARNITSGVSEVLNKHPEVVVVEDDVLVGPHFLKFMNDALAYYRNIAEVGSVTGYCYPVKQKLPETFFIKGADCWGWGTWRDRWSLYNPDGTELLNELEARGLERELDFEGSQQYLQMLKDQIAKKNDSWAVRWHVSCFLKGRLILYPGRSLVQNIGNDGSGTHAIHYSKKYEVEVCDTPIRVGGIAIEENKAGQAAFRKFFRTPRRSKIRMLIGRLGLRTKFRATVRWLRSLWA